MAPAGRDRPAATMKIQIELDDQQARAALRRLIHSGRDLSPVLRDIGEHLLNAARQRFNEERSPEDKPWAPLSPTTLKRKRLNQDKILIQDGHLQGTLNYRVGKDHIDIGSPRIHAGVQQFGAAKGAFGTARKGAPTPWGDIPARPFLGLSQEDRREIENSLLDFIKEHWERG